MKNMIPSNLFIDLVCVCVSQYKKLPSYQYRDSHVKDKMVSQLSYLNMGIPIHGKDCLYIETGPGFPENWS